MDSPNSDVPAFDSTELKDLKEKLVDGCHILDREGITDGFGHVSVRIPGNEAFLTSRRKPWPCDLGSARHARLSTVAILAAKNHRPTNGRFTPASCALVRT